MNGSFVRIVATLAVVLATSALPATAQTGWQKAEVCVVVGNELREIVVDYNRNTGTRLIEGRALEDLHPASKPPYAEGAPWYTSNGPLVAGGRPFGKFGLPRVLKADELEFVGAHEGVPIFAGDGEGQQATVFYVPVRPGCEFQPYSLVENTPDASAAVRRVQKEQIQVTTSPGDFITIEEIRFALEYTEVLLRFYSPQPYGGVFHPPGAENAMELRADGATHALLGMTGWLGSGTDRYGDYTVPANTERLVILQFRPVEDLWGVRRLSLIEGACASACWHFVDVRLRDH
jgi:hypothetical protein